jgi:uncharacterized sulfatase
MISRIAAEMNRGTPPSLYDAELDETKPPYEEQGLPAEEVTIAEILKEKGYATFHIWKVAPGKEKWHGTARAGIRSEFAHG